MISADIYLYIVPTYGPNDVLMGNPALPRPRGRGYVGTTIDERKELKRHIFGLGEVVAETLYDNLVERYGEVTGAFIYFKMEGEGKGPFAPGAKYDPSRRRRR